MNGTHIAYGRENGSNTMIYMVHGILGSPAQFRFLADSLPESVDYRCALLPGHGGTMCAFRCMRAENWLDSIHETAAELRAKYDRLIYVGHSMGCLLGLIENARTRFDDMLLISCPLKLRLSAQYFSMGWRAAAEKHPRDPRVQAARDALSVRAESPIAYLGALRPYFELLKVIHAARNACDGASGSAFFSDGDEIVSARSAEWLGHFRAETLPDSGHFLYSERAKARLRETLNAMARASSTGVDFELKDC